MNPQTNLVTSMLPVKTQLLINVVIITSFLSSVYSAETRFNDGFKGAIIVGPQVRFFRKKKSQIRKVICLIGAGSNGGSFSYVGDVLKEKDCTRKIFQIRWFIF